MGASEWWDGDNAPSPTRFAMVREVRSRHWNAELRADNSDAPGCDRNAKFTPAFDAIHESQSARTAQKIGHHAGDRGKTTL